MKTRAGAGKPVWRKGPWAFSYLEGQTVVQEVTDERDTDSVASHTCCLNMMRASWLSSG